MADEKRYTDKEKKLLDYIKSHQGSNVTEAAKACGYRDGGYVSRALKKLSEYGELKGIESREGKIPTTRYYTPDQAPTEKQGYEKFLFDLHELITHRPGIDTDELASFTNTNSEKVRYGIATLVAKKLVSKEGGRGRLNTYYPIKHEESDSPKTLESQINERRFHGMTEEAQAVYNFVTKYQLERRDQKKIGDKFPDSGLISEGTQMPKDRVEQLLKELQSSRFVTLNPITVDAVNPEGEKEKQRKDVYMALPVMDSLQRRGRQSLEYHKAKRELRIEPVDRVILNNENSGLNPTLITGGMRAGHKDVAWYFLKEMKAYLDSLPESEKPSRAILMGDSIEGEHRLSESKVMRLLDERSLDGQLSLYKNFLEEYFGVPILSVLGKQEVKVMEHFAMESMEGKSAFKNHGVDASSMQPAIRSKLWTEELHDRIDNARKVLLPYMMLKGQELRTSEDLGSVSTESKILMEVYKGLTTSWDDIKSGRMTEDQFRQKYTTELQLIDYDKVKHIVSTLREPQTELNPEMDTIVGHLDFEEGGIHVKGSAADCFGQPTRTSSNIPKTITGQMHALGDQKYKAPNVRISGGHDTFAVEYYGETLYVDSPGLKNTPDNLDTDILNKMQQDSSHRATNLLRKIKKPSAVILKGGGTEPYSFEIWNSRFLERIAQSIAKGEPEEKHTIALISDVHPGSPTHQAEFFVKYLWKALMEEQADIMYALGDLVHGRNYSEFVNEGERSSDGGPGKIRIDSQTQLLLGEMEPFLEHAPKLERMKIISGNHEKNSLYKYTGVEYALRELELTANSVGLSREKSDVLVAEQITAATQDRNRLIDLLASMESSGAPNEQKESLKTAIDAMSQRIDASIKSGKPYLRAELYTDILIPRGDKKPDYVPNAELLTDRVAGYYIAGQHRWNDGGMAHRGGGASGGVGQMEYWIDKMQHDAEPLDILLGGHYHTFHMKEHLQKLLLHLGSTASMSNFELHKALRSTVAGVTMDISNRAPPKIRFYTRSYMDHYNPEGLWDLFKGGKDGFEDLVRDPLKFRGKIRTI